MQQGTGLSSCDCVLLVLQLARDQSELQRLQVLQAALQQQQANSAKGLLQRILSSAATTVPPPVTAAGVGVAAGGNGAVDLPEAPRNVPQAVGVIVEEGQHCYYVKVNCKDRKGLLSDITNAMQELSLEITRAAITTSHEGSVYDVFEIQAEHASGVTALDVQCQVHTALYKHRLNEIKRQRSN